MAILPAGLVYFILYHKWRDRMTRLRANKKVKIVSITAAVLCLIVLPAIRTLIGPIYLDGLPMVLAFLGYGILVFLMLLR